MRPLLPLIVTTIIMASCTQDHAARRFDPLNGSEYAEKRIFSIEGADPKYPRPGFTYATSDLFYGVQVEYFAPDGKSYLWFRGNKRSVPSEWKVTQDGFARELCFRYGPNTRDAITGTRGGKWECRKMFAGDMSVVSFIPGDPFNLAKGTVPDMKLKRCQIPPPMKQMLYTNPCI